MENSKKLKKMLCKEIDGIAEKGQMSAGDLEILHKLTGTLKNISTIDAMEGEGSEYSGNYSGRYDGGMSVADRSYGRNYGRNDGGRSYGRYSGNHDEMEDEEQYSGRRNYVHGYYRN